MDVFLFSFDLGYATAAMKGGMAGVVVDWEWREKSERQRGRDTEINHGTSDDLKRMRAAVSGRLICRINNHSEARASETRLALEAGADEIWLPMVRDIAEVVECLRLVDGEAELGILAETREALSLGKEFSQLPLSRVFVGLHDLCIDTGGRGLFDPLVDGTVERFRESYRGHLGFAGVTRPDAGHPVPQRLLLSEMARLGCDFGIARRSFRADVAPSAIAAALVDINDEMTRLTRRSAAERARDHTLFVKTVSADLEMSCAP